MRRAFLAFIQRAHFAHGHTYDEHTVRMFRSFHRRVADDVAAASTWKRA